MYVSPAPSAPAISRLAMPSASSAAKPPFAIRAITAANAIPSTPQSVRTQVDSFGGAASAPSDFATTLCGAISHSPSSSGTKRGGAACSGSRRAHSIATKARTNGTATKPPHAPTAASPTAAATIAITTPAAMGVRPPATSSSTRRRRCASGGRSAGSGSPGCSFM